jgi:hypothetical protein
VADPCSALEHQVSSLQAELTSLSEGFGDDLKDAAGSLKAGLVKQHQKELQDAKAKLAAARAK